MGFEQEVSENDHLGFAIYSGGLKESWTWLGHLVRRGGDMMMCTRVHHKVHMVPNQTT